MYRLDRICFDEAFRFSLSAMQRFAGSSDAVTVVAEAPDGSIAGFAIGEREGEVLYLVTLDVAPAMRRLKLAHTMLNWLEEHTPNARWMDLHVFEENSEALSFYEREGFACLGRELDFYGQGLHALTCRRAIRRSN